MGINTFYEHFQSSAKPFFVGIETIMVSMDMSNEIGENYSQTKNKKKYYE